MNLDLAISYLTANFAYAPEFQNIFMAIQGAMIVRTGPNKDGKMKPFHAFLQGVVLAYAGGLLTPLWMGRPTPMLSNDLCFASCIIAYLVVNNIPLDIGYKFLNTFPLRVLTVMGAQMFRNRGILAFVNIAYQAFKDSPSAYYPTPIFGPILNACILGNMGGFFFKGFHGHLCDGMPFAAQNGIFVASTYHFVANDQGPIGEYLRDWIGYFLLPLVKNQGGNVDMDAVLLVTVLGGLFMQLVGILQMPDFYGPTFNPFQVVFAPVNFLWPSSSTSSSSTKGVAVVGQPQKVEKTTTTTTTTPKVAAATTNNVLSSDGEVKTAKSKKSTQNKQKKKTKKTQ
mmetsp:Transcript_7711/g.14540  ORF Transcript_7711/g.14540 Transcript_7711/m.14540 type:complete len:340 (-) Transcript_7711:491-1510(-)